MVTKRVEPVGSRRGGASLVLLAGAGVGMPEAVDLPCQEALRLRNNRSLTELLLSSQQGAGCLDGLAGFRWHPQPPCWIPMDSDVLQGPLNGVLFVD